MSTRLQKLFKDVELKSTKPATKEDFDNALRKFGLECYVQASRGNLFQQDYQCYLREVKENE